MTAVKTKENTNKQIVRTIVTLTVNSPQFTSQILSPKNEVHIASRNSHHVDSSGTPNVLENSFIYSPAL